MPLSTADKAETKPRHTASSLGLPWKLTPQDDGYELGCIEGGWLYRVHLDDTIGRMPRTAERSDFLEAQREVAEFILHASNCHHDLLAALKFAQKVITRFANDTHIPAGQILACCTEVDAAITKAIGDA